MAEAPEPIDFHYILSAKLVSNGYGGREMFHSDVIRLSRFCTQENLWLAVAHHAMHAKHVPVGTQMIPLFYRCEPNERT